jgi:hypothetical protein
MGSCPGSCEERRTGRNLSGAWSFLRLSPMVHLGKPSYPLREIQIQIMSAIGTTTVGRSCCRPDCGILWLLFFAICRIVFPALELGTNQNMDCRQWY